MTASTLQVQLCEYRQFRHSVARVKYGLPDDDSMRGLDMDKKRKPAMDPENFVELNEAKRCVQFDVPVGDTKIHFEVPLAAVGNRKMVAARVAAMCFYKLVQHGEPEKDVEKFRDSVLEGHREAEDVPEDSEAWAECKIQLSHPSPLCSYQIVGKDGKMFPFQTTMAAAGGALECERVARLCYVKLKNGMTKEDAKKFRDDLYKKRHADGSGGSLPKKKEPRVEG